MSDPPPSIFRKVALDRLASPEQLDQLLQWTPSLRLPPFRAGAFVRRLGKRSSCPPTKHVKTPTVLQMESVECGAAALAMVLGFYRRIVPLEELRVVCGVGRDGSKASNLIKAAHGYGLKAKGYKKDPDALTALPLPLIAFWNFNHFVVVEGFGSQNVYLNDPALGRRVVSNEEFDQSFTGVVLVFAPGPDFMPGGVRRSVWQAVRERVRGAERIFPFVALIGMLLVIPGLLIPLFAQMLVDDVLLADRAHWLVPLLGGLSLTAVLRAACMWVQTWLLLRLQIKHAMHATGEFAWHLLHLPIAFFTQRYTGDIGDRVQLNDRVARLLFGVITPTLLSAVFVVAYALLMAQYDPLLTLIGIGAALLNIVVLRLMASRQAAARQRLSQDQGQFAGTAYAGVHAIETIKASGMEEDLFVRWAGYQAKVANAEQALAISTHMAAVVAALIASLSTIAILVIGSLRVMDGALTLGMLVAFQTLLASLLQPFNRIATLGSAVQEMTGSIARIDDVLRYPRDPQLSGNDATTSSAAPLSGLVELRNVSFGYSRMDPPLIETLSFTIQPGKRVALVGGSGSGKSTVAKLVAGLYEPWGGEILFDGQRRAAISRTVVTQSLAMVDQDVRLFGGTLRDNITLWNEHIGQDAVIAAARDAAMHDEIVARPGGYDSLIREGGRDLSGGQRQRLEIARALCGDPTILVLDEATSALDPIIEQTIDAHLRRRGCTMVIVAHRLSTIRDADEILVLEQGKVVQRGTHDDLIRVPGPYARLINADAPVPTPADAPIVMQS